MALAFRSKGGFAQSHEVGEGVLVEPVWLDPLMVPEGATTLNPKRDCIVKSHSASPHYSAAGCMIQGGYYLDARRYGSKGFQSKDALGRHFSEDCSQLSNSWLSALSSDAA